MLIFSIYFIFIFSKVIYHITIRALIQSTYTT